MDYADLARHITHCLVDYGYSRLYEEELTSKAGYPPKLSKRLVRQGLEDVIKEAIEQFADGQHTSQGEVQ